MTWMLFHGITVKKVAGQVSTYSTHLIRVLKGTKCFRLSTGILARSYRDLRFRFQVRQKIADATYRKDY